jgi:hypothetical protein
MYDVDMTRIEAKLEAAFANEAESTLTLAEVIRLRRYMATLKNELRELNIKHLKVVNESVPIDYVKSLRVNNEKVTEELRGLKENLKMLEFNIKGRCPICYRSADHTSDCWLGNALDRYVAVRTRVRV